MSAGNDERGVLERGTSRSLLGFGDRIVAKMCGRGGRIFGLRLTLCMVPGMREAAVWNIEGMKMSDETRAITTQTSARHEWISEALEGGLRYRSSETGIAASGLGMTYIEMERPLSSVSLQYIDEERHVRIFIGSEDCVSRLLPDQKRGICRCCEWKTVG